MSGLEERERAVELYFTTPMTTAQVVEHLGYPTRQCLERWLAMDSGMLAIWPNPSSHWRPGEGQSGRCWAACSRSRPPNGSARASARCMAGSGRTARAAWPRCSPKTGTPRRAISPRTPAAGRPQPMMMTRRLCAAGSRNRSRGNALMREVVEARRKRPRHRPAAPVEQGEDPVDRPVEAGVFARRDDMPARHRARRPPLPPRPARRWQVRRTRGGGGRGVRRFQGQVRVPRDQGGAQDRRIGEDGPQDHGGGRARGARAQATQVWFLRGRDDAGSRQSRRPGLHGRASEREVADGHHRDQGQGREGRAFRR